MFVSKARYEQDVEQARQFAEQQQAKHIRALSALRQIVEQGSTENPNSTVKRIVAIAKTVLNDGGTQA